MPAGLSGWEKETERRERWRWYVLSTYWVSADIYPVGARESSCRRAKFRDSECLAVPGPSTGLVFLLQTGAALKPPGPGHQRA